MQPVLSAWLLTLGHVAREQAMWMKSGSHQLWGEEMESYLLPKCILSLPSCPPLLCSTPPGYPASLCFPASRDLEGEWLCLDSPFVLWCCIINFSSTLTNTGDNYITKRKGLIGLTVQQILGMTGWTCWVEGQQVTVECRASRGFHLCSVKGGEKGLEPHDILQGCISMT